MGYDSDTRRELCAERWSRRLTVQFDVGGAFTWFSRREAIPCGGSCVYYLVSLVVVDLSFDIR